MKAANALVADILVELRDAVKPGVTTADLDALAEARVRAAQAASPGAGATSSVSASTSFLP